MKEGAVREERSPEADAIDLRNEDHPVEIHEIVSTSLSSTGEVVMEGEKQGGVADCGGKKRGKEEGQGETDLTFELEVLDQLLLWS